MSSFSALRARPLAAGRWLPWLLLAACGECGACGDSAEPAASTRAPLVAPEATAPHPSAESNDGSDVVWAEVSVDDKVPICVFGNYADFAESSYPDDVRPSALKVGEPAHFGAWPGWCVNGACDGRPSMQCNVELEGQTLVVHTRYWGTRKDSPDCGGATCLRIYAGCKTPPLQKGTYNVRYGDRAFTLEVPGKRGDPCFGMRDERHPGPHAF